MKLHQVKTSNLNSLYGEHVIDFEKDLHSAPLFLILGQTGAGKSTILDAICVALFGRTPRLTRSTGKPETDARHLMSYGTGRCHAEVIFSLRNASGERHKYRAVWECRRAREKPGGNLQDAVRSLFKWNEELEDFEELISDNRQKYFEPHFEEILEGMTVEDFQRSILLAQGEFAAFLKADEEVKANILEKLTSTDEYRRIGQRAATKRREADRELTQLKAQLDGLQILDDEDERELREQLADLEGALELTRADFEKTQQAITWMTQRDALTQALEKIAQHQLLLQKQLGEHSEDRQLLERDRIARPAQLTLERVDASREQSATLTAALNSLTTEADGARTAREQAELHHTAQKKALKTSRAALESARPELEKARGLAREQATAQQELTRAKEHHAEGAVLLEGAVLAHKVAQQDVLKITARHEEASATLAALSGAEALGEHVEVLAAQVSHFQEGAQRLADAQARAAEAKQSLEAIKATLAEHSTIRERAQQQLEPRREAVERARAALDEHLAGAATPALRREALEKSLDTAREGLAGVEEVMRLHEDVVARRTERAQNKRDLAAHERDIKERGARVEALDATLAGERATLQALTLGLRALEDQLILSDHRKHLGDEDACPLCGGLEHPLLSAQSFGELEATLQAERDTVKASRDALTKRVASLQEEQRELELDLASLESVLANTSARQSALGKELDRLMERYNGARHRVGEQAVDTFPGTQEKQDALREAMVVRRGELNLSSERARKTLALLDESVSALDAARDALRQSEEEQREVVNASAQLESRLELRTAALAEASEQAAQAGARHELARATLQQRFVSAQIALELDASEQPDFVAGVKSARDLRARFDAAQKSLAQITTARDAAQQHVERCLEKSEQASRAHAKLVAELERRQRAADTLEAARASILEGRDPAQVEATLQLGVTMAESALTQAASALAESTSKLERLQGSLQEKTSQHEQARTTQAELEQELAQHAQTLSLSEEQLRASLLAGERRSELEATFEALDQQLHDAKHERERTLTQQAEHLEQRPEDERFESLTPQKWEQEHARLKKEVEEHLSERGALLSQVEAQELAKKRSAHIRVELTGMQDKFRVWETIHRLIGTRDGEGFKLFAQSLNLQELVDRANMRLAKLSPRYSLAVATGDNNEPKLDFAMVDHHQADAHRPLTTLSGGETFLVSLALALGLSDFRRVEMPVETLLLDEGFGTLDQETLDVAMATLRQLQQESVQQIGIISHVESLKDRVDTRIVVEKLGNGRSTLFAEGNGVRRALQA